MERLRDDILTCLAAALAPVPTNTLARRLGRDPESVARELHALVLEDVVLAVRQGSGVAWTLSGSGRRGPPGAGPGAPSSSPAQLRAELRAERVKTARLEHKLADAHDKLRLLRDQLELALRGGGTPDLDMDAHLADLLVLCHPDRHQDDPRATRVTRWLIAERQRRR